MRLIFSIMTKENEKTSEKAVMTAMAQFLSNLWFEEDFREQPDYLTEIFKIMLESEMGNDLSLRTKMMSCIRTSKMLAKTLEPFSDKQIQKACSKFATV